MTVTPLCMCEGGLAILWPSGWDMNMVSLASLSIPTCQASLSQPHRPFVSPHCHQHQASTDTKLQDTDLIFIHLFQSKQKTKKCCCYNGKTLRICFVWSAWTQTVNSEAWCWRLSVACPWRRNTPASACLADFSIHISYSSRFSWRNAQPLTLLLHPRELSCLTENTLIHWNNGSRFCSLPGICQFCFWGCGWKKIIIMNSSRMIVI